MKTRRYTGSSSRQVEEKSLPQLPFDLIFEILTKLPAKSIARFLCLSKVCGSTLISPNFADSFLTISLSRPKLLFTCQKDGETFFFSSPQPQNASLVTASFHMSFPINCPGGVYRPVCGLVCGLDQRTINKRIVTVPLLCNPSTGESLTLPRVKTRRKRVIVYLGYDPIDKQFKVLCMTHSIVASWSSEHQVLTIEAGKKLSWRKIKCDIPHHPEYPECIYGLYGYPQCRYDGICINGVFYYLAMISRDICNGDADIVCFDIRYEKFSFINKSHQDKSWRHATLVSYKGKLAKLKPDIVNQMYNGIHLCVLEDAQKHQWSSYSYILPFPLRNIFQKVGICFAGMTSTGEIVLSPKKQSDSLYLLYYNPETGTATTVGIQGMEAFKTHRVYIFLDHVENVKLLASV